MATDVETARESYKAWNAGDREAFLEYIDPEVEWHPPAEGLEGPVHGRDGVRSMLESFQQAFDEIRLDPVRIEGGGEPGEVVAVLDVRTRGRGSGAEVKVRVAHLLRYRDGKLVWGKVYPKAGEGLDAAGLDPTG